jgi:cytosine deaminase
MDASVETLRDIAELKIETGFEGRSSSAIAARSRCRTRREALDTLDLVAKAGIDVVSLPMCNLYLQDRTEPGGRTPRRAASRWCTRCARGIRVSFASDNTRDPFYAYGDMDMLEVMREATRIGHLDHSAPTGWRAFLTAPAATCGFDAPSLAPGAPADLVIVKARKLDRAFRPPASRPHRAARGAVSTGRCPITPNSTP